MGGVSILSQLPCQHIGMLVSHGLFLTDTHKKAAPLVQKRLSILGKWGYLFFCFSSR